VAVFINTPGAKGAEILIDDKPYGPAPQLIGNLLEGSHRLVLRKDNYLLWHTDLEIKKDVQSEVRAYMITYEGSVQAQRDTWATRRNRTFIGAAVLAGAAAGFKWYADQRYDDYQKTVRSQDAVDSRNDVELFNNLTTGALIGSGVMAIWTLYNHIQKNRVAIPDQKIKMDYNPEKHSLSLQIAF